MRLARPPLLFLACLTGAGALQLFKPVEIAPYSFTTGLIAGGLSVCAAAALGAWAIREMKLHRTPLEPGEVPSCLVTGGPFHYTRNPLYVSLLLVFTGIAIAINSAWFLFGVVVLLLLLDRLVVAREEIVIQQTFEADYTRYVSNVRRWL